MAAHTYRIYHKFTARLDCYIVVILVLSIQGLFLSNAVEIQMNPDIYEYQGSNGSALICTWTLLREDKFLQLAFSINSAAIVNLYSTVPSLSEDGKYLTGRVILGNLSNINSNSTHITSEARITFTDLQCVDDNIYSCSVGYSNSKKGGEITQKSSKTSKLNVKVLPARPLNIILLEPNYDNDTEKYDSLDVTTQKSSNLNTSLHHQNTSNKDFAWKNGENVEGSITTIVCTGEVGNPPENLTVQRIRNDGTVDELNADSKPINMFIGNCSFYQNMSFTIQLTEGDNGSLFRCAVSSFIDVDGWYIQTDPIVVLFPVRTPLIEVQPDPPTNLPIRLSCYGRGNPMPDYAWYRVLNTCPIGSIEMYSNSQNITLYKKTAFGVYRCEVKNTLNQDVYRKTTNITVELKANPIMITKSPNQTAYAEGTKKITLTCLLSSCPDSPYRWILPEGSIISGNTVVITNLQRKDSGVYTCLVVNTAYSEPRIVTATDKVIIEKNKLDADVSTKTTCNCVPGILGSVFGMLGICLVTSIVVFMWLSRGKTLSGTDRGSQMVMTSMGDQGGSSNYEGINGERTDHHYDELQRPEQHYHNTQNQHNL